MDDSQTPKLRDDNHWIEPQLNGICNKNTQNTPRDFVDVGVCFGAGYNLTDQASCENAGCCCTKQPNDQFKRVSLNLYWNGDITDNVVSTFMPSQTGYLAPLRYLYIFVHQDNLPLHNMVRLIQHIHHLDLL